MKLKIVISSAVKLEEKKCVKDKLIELQRLNIIKIDWIYDCAEHATVWGTITKQEEINDIILSADWFICLIPQHTVGYNTWKELELVLEAQKRNIPSTTGLPMLVAQAKKAHEIFFDTKVDDEICEI